MKTQRRFIQTADTNKSRTSQLLTSRIPPTKLIQSQIKQKINTFINWNAQSCIRSRRNSRKVQKQEEEQSNDNQNMMKALMKFADEMKRKQKLHALNKKRQTIGQNNGQFYLQNQRQRFKRMSNPLQFIQFYIKNNKFNPNECQKMLLDKLIQIKAFLESMQNLHLDRVLQQIYELMNMAVDFNQLRLIIVATVLAADICFQAKDYNRSVFFYDQAKTSAQYSGFSEIVSQSLIGLARITCELCLSTCAIRFLKKALAYAWQQNDSQTETQIYDLLGQSYCNEGRMKQAEYYHQKFAQNYLENQGSAIRKIYLQILKDDAKSRNLRLYSDNADKLFLETVNLPIYNFKIYPKFKSNITFQNYYEGQSPRKQLINKNFSFNKFDSAEIQIKNMLNKPQFQVQMPEPDIQSLYTPSNRYSKKRRDLDFVQTVQYHEMTGTKFVVSQPNANRKYPIQKQLQLILSTKPDPLWYEKMSSKVKRERMQKLGSLRDPVRRSHSKTHQRSRSMSNQSQNIRKSVNKAILSWIDPIQ